MSKVRKLTLWSLCVAVIASFVICFGLTNAKIVKADTEFTSDAITGVNAAYDDTKEACDSLIVTEKMDTVRAGGNKFVIYQYDLLASSPAATSRYAMLFGGTTAVNDGIMYGTANSYCDPLYEDTEGDLGCGMFYKDGESPLFLSTDFNNKTVTVVWNRDTAAIQLYTSDIGDTINFSVSSTAVTVTGATSRSISLPSAIAFWGNNTSSSAVATCTTVSKWSQRCGLMLGNGTATMKNIKAFDGTGKQLALTFGNDFTVEYSDPGEEVISACSNTDIEIGMPINLLFNTSNNAAYVNYQTINTVVSGKSMVYSADDYWPAYTMKKNFGATLTTDGQALGFWFNGNVDRKVQITLKKSIKVSDLESVTFRIWGSGLTYNTNRTTSSGISLFNSADTNCILGTDSVYINEYLPSDYAVVGTDYVYATVPGAAIACLADGSGDLTGFQLFANGNNAGAFLFIDEITYTPKANTLDGLGTQDGASIRLGDYSGLGFITRVDLSAYNGLVSIYGEENVETGTIITATDLLGTNQFTVEKLDAELIHYKKIVNGGFKNVDTAETDGYYEWRGSLVNIKEGNLDRAFSGRGYIAVTNNDETTYYYAETGDNSRSARAVALAAYKDVSDTNTGVYDMEITLDTHFEKGKYSPFSSSQLTQIKSYLTYNELKEEWFTFGMQSDLSDTGYDNVVYSSVTDIYTLTCTGYTYMYFSPEFITFLIDTNGDDSLTLTATILTGEGATIEVCASAEQGVGFARLGFANQSASGTTGSLENYRYTGLFVRLLNVTNNFGDATTGLSFSITENKAS